MRPILVVLLLLRASVALSQIATLSVSLSDGNSFTHALRDIQEVSFDADSLAVAYVNEYRFTYPIADIRHIQFELDSGATTDAERARAHELLGWDGHPGTGHPLCAHEGAS